MRNSIRTRLLIFFIGLTVVPVLLVSVVTGIQTFNAQIQQALLLQTQIAGRESSQLRDFFQSVQTQLNTAARQPDLRIGTFNQQQLTLSGLLGQGDVFSKIFLLDSKGQEQVGVSRSFAIAAADLISRAQADEFKVPAIHNKVYYGPVHTDPTSSEPVITIATPIENISTGTVDGVLVADLRFLAVQGLIADDNPADLASGRQSTLFLLDASGQVITSNDLSLTLRGLHFTPSAQDSVQNGLKGTSVVLASAPLQLGDQNFTIVAETPTSQALASVYSTATFSVILTLLTLIVTISAVLAFVNQIVKPISSLAATARAIQGGDLSVQAVVTSKDEIGGLALAFNNMTAQLRQTLNGLQDHVRELDEARQETERQRAFLRQIIDAIPNVIQAKDTDGRITLSNETSARYYGTTVDTMLGKTIGEINPNSSEVAEMRQDDLKVIETGVLVRLPEQQVTNAAGETRWNQTVKLPIVGQGGEVRQVLTVAVDITELKQAEVQREALIKDLQAARRLAEENSRLKSEFLSTMSHELRTPLNAIEGFAGILLNKIGGTDYNDKTEGYLTRIRLNSKRLLQLINDFLDLSRVEAGRLDLANQPFSPVQLAKRWQDEIGVLAEKKGLGLVVTLDPRLPETVYGDEEAISKVALNLLGNAIKFTEHGQIKLALTCADESWYIIIEDTGIGIPPHAREFIFEEFRQVDQTSKRKYGGTGLGLAIVQKYTRAMGGTVQVKSELGKGSTFSISLPVRITA